MTWQDYDPASLPSIDAVEVVHLGVFEETFDAVFRMQDAPHVRLSADLAQEVARLWRQLKPGQQMRCHEPVYGLRFYQYNAVLLQASVCWECNNIFIRDADSDETLTYEFDAPHRHAQALLQICRRVIQK